MTGNTAQNREQEECRKERDNAFETLNKDQAEYDKQLLTLSAAFLGVSLAFVKDVVPLRDVAHLWEFDVAIGCLLACVGAVLWTFQYSIHGHLGLAAYWNLKEESLQLSEDGRAEAKKKLDESQSKVSQRAKRIRAANIASGIVFAAGTVFLVIFVTTNMRREAYSATVACDRSAQRTVAPCINKKEPGNITVVHHQ